MTIFWPGLIAGLVLVAVCIIGYRKRDALAANMGKGYSSIVGRKAAEKFRGSVAQRQANLLIPIFMGTALGSAIIILSVTGVMR